MDDKEVDELREVVKLAAKIKRERQERIDYLKGFEWSRTEEEDNELKKLLRQVEGE